LTPRDAASLRRRPSFRGGQGAGGLPAQVLRMASVRVAAGGGGAGGAAALSAAALTTFTVDSPTSVVFERDPDLRQLRAHVTHEFRTQFEAGLVHYLSGEWGLAREELEKANEMMKEKVPALGGDGPSLALLHFMGLHGFKVPPAWMNYRPLTSK